MLYKYVVLPTIVLNLGLGIHNILQPEVLPVYAVLNFGAALFLGLLFLFLAITKRW